MQRVLIANRGEIAVRIIRACHQLGIETVAVYSDADARAMHVQLADHAVHIGPAPAVESYLNIERVMEAVRSSGADAVHPGYGFLAENPAFAEAVVAAGATFIGPSAAAMRAVGDKAAAKQIAQAADVPTVPEWDVASVPADAFPVLIKASAGGGGRGMRVVERPDDMADAVASAAREAAAGFGDDTLLVERLVRHARHVEVQLLADAHGTVLYVGDRDCSLQRRHQKVVEEAPAFGLDSVTRTALGEAAVRIARAAGYENAGTAEFLVAPDGNWYFLELNARLQVEHPATELAFGIDLVTWQLRIARGEHLTIAQHNLRPVAHAIEARIYAEDPFSFLPTGGTIIEAHLPTGAGIRVDHAVEAGTTVSLNYDPMIAKVLATGPTREAAREALIHALRSTALPGVVTNIPLLLHSLELPAFIDESHHTGTLESAPLDDHLRAIPNHVERAARRAQFLSGQHNPFAMLHRWRASSATPALPTAAESDVHITACGDTLWVCWRGHAWEIPRHTIDAAHAHATEDHGDRAALTAPMPGTVIRALEPGTMVRAGEPVVVLEAMKMENTIAAPFDGVVESVACSVGDLVTRGAVLAEVTRDAVLAEVAP
jgi:acetyl/propionyl-CoA carboxylase alpha subunit